MEHISIETTQNVPIEYEIANLGDRVIAYLVDLFVVFGYLIMASAIISALPALPAWAYWTIFLLPIMLYDLVLEIMLSGQTIGKRVRNIKVARLDGAQPDISNYLLRWLLRPVDILIFFGAIGIVAILWSGKGQRLGDMVTGTTVIKIKQRVHLEDTILVNVEDDHQVVFPQVEKLSDQDIDTIKEVLRQHRITEDNKLRRTLARKAGERLQELLGISADMPADDFFDQVIKDYNFIKGSG